MHQNHGVTSNDAMNRKDTEFVKTVFGMCRKLAISVKVIDIARHNHPKPLLLLDEKGVNERFGGKSPNK